jgi:hypothetical protein
VLHLLPDRFEIAKLAFFYGDVCEVIVRARPLHLDVHFDKQPRLRFLSALVQQCVNELWHRTGRKLKVRAK